MIRSLEGMVLSRMDDGIVLDVNGLGFEVKCSGTALRLSESSDHIRLVTYLQISENGVSLFGFADEDERNVFLKLTSIKGVGGKLALTVLRSLSASEVINAVVSGDQATFKNVPGIGSKTAERICFELQRYFDSTMVRTSMAGSDKVNGTRATVISALRSLGFSNYDISVAIRKLNDETPQILDQEDEGILLKALLKELNRI